MRLVLPETLALRPAQQAVLSSQQEAFPVPRDVRRRWGEAASRRARRVRPEVHSADVVLRALSKAHRPAVLRLAESQSTARAHRSAQP